MNTQYLLGRIFETDSKRLIDNLNLYIYLEFYALKCTFLIHNLQYIDCKTFVI